jgi:hypothetical protein
MVAGYVPLSPVMMGVPMRVPVLMAAKRTQ